MISVLDMSSDCEDYENDPNDEKYERELQELYDFFDEIGIPEVINYVKVNINNYRKYLTRGYELNKE